MAATNGWAVCRSGANVGHPAEETELNADLEEGTMRDVIIVGLLIAILFATSNPPLAAHQQATVEAVRRVASGTASEEDAVTKPGGNLERLWAALTAEAAAGLTHLMDDVLFKYRSYVLFSTMSAPNGQVISIGVLGQIITF